MPGSTTNNHLGCFVFLPRLQTFFSLEPSNIHSENNLHVIMDFLPKNVITKWYLMVLTFYLSIWRSFVDFFCCFWTKKSAAVHVLTQKINKRLELLMRVRKNVEKLFKKSHLQRKPNHWFEKSHPIPTYYDWNVVEQTSANSNDKVIHF